MSWALSPRLCSRGGCCGVVVDCGGRSGSAPGAVSAHSETPNPRPLASHPPQRTRGVACRPSVPHPLRRGSMPFLLLMVSGVGYLSWRSCTCPGVDVQRFCQEIPSKATLVCERTRLCARTCGRVRLVMCLLWWLCVCVFLCVWCLCVCVFVCFCAAAEGWRPS